MRTEEIDSGSTRHSLQWDQGFSQSGSKWSNTWSARTVKDLVTPFWSKGGVISVLFGSKGVVTHSAIARVRNGQSAGQTVKKRPGAPTVTRLFDQFCNGQTPDRENFDQVFDHVFRCGGGLRARSVVASLSPIKEGSTGIDSGKTRRLNSVRPRDNERQQPGPARARRPVDGRAPPPPGPPDRVRAARDRVVPPVRVRRGHAWPHGRVEGVGRRGVRVRGLGGGPRGAGLARLRPGPEVPRRGRGGGGGRGGGRRRRRRGTGRGGDLAPRQGRGAGEACSFRETVWSGIIEIEAQARGSHRPPEVWS
ncbi:hypothetical protein THAOC_20124 [Thalassiosira oceanica]|uniref:Uncharacterized protein n=1 Tax=Thalassiosira oceanica TaxID=159749 RepID=K0SME9_THAOC|nr:hypothetical protein THAOC_20124 [Thalassiosira oceanica]|eukprot:EJK59622.1 hypothetical protein THAOC_20124 [Thalassiosira oceanica]